MLLVVVWVCLGCHVFVCLGLFGLFWFVFFSSRVGLGCFGFVWIGFVWDGLGLFGFV